MVKSLLYKVQHQQAQVPVAEYLQECVDVDKFLGYCQQCENYNRRWSCPTFDFAPMDICRRFKSLWLVNCVLTPLPGTTLEQLLAGLQQEKNRLHDALLNMEKQNTGAWVLSAGSCRLCEEGCSRPQGQPCRRPERMRYSLEALGGDVGKTAELYFKQPLVWIEKGEMPAYLTLVGGLLLTEEIKGVCFDEEREFSIPTGLFAG